MAFHFEFRQVEPDVTVAVLSGMLNLGSRVAEFEQAIKQRIWDGSRKMVFDMTGLTYIDSAGLGMVATCAGNMSKAGGKVVVVSPGGKITQMFEITRLNRIISIFTDVVEACESFPDATEETKQT